MTLRFFRCCCCYNLIVLSSCATMYAAAVCLSFIIFILTNTPQRIASDSLFSASPCSRSWRWWWKKTSHEESNQIFSGGTRKERNSYKISFHSIVWLFLAAVMATSTACWNSSFVASSAAVFIPFVSFHFFTIHCKCSIVYSSSCYPLLYLHFHSITFVRGFWFSLFPLSHSPTLSFISRRNRVQKKTEMKFIQLHVVGVIVIIGYY